METDEDHDVISVGNPPASTQSLFPSPPSSETHPNRTPTPIINDRGHSPSPTGSQPPASGSDKSGTGADGTCQEEDGSSQATKSLGTESAKEYLSYTKNDGIVSAGGCSDSYGDGGVSHGIYVSSGGSDDGSEFSNNRIDNDDDDNILWGGRVDQREDDNGDMVFDGIDNEPEEMSAIDLSVDDDNDDVIGMGLFKFSEDDYNAYAYVDKNTSQDESSSFPVVVAHGVSDKADDDAKKVTETAPDASSESGVFVQFIPSMVSLMEPVVSPQKRFGDADGNDDDDENLVFMFLSQAAEGGWVAATTGDAKKTAGMGEGEGSANWGMRVFREAPPLWMEGRGNATAILTLPPSSLPPLLSEDDEDDQSACVFNRDIHRTRYAKEERRPNEMHVAITEAEGYLHDRTASCMDALNRILTPRERRGFEVLPDDVTAPLHDDVTALLDGNSKGEKSDLRGLDVDVKAESRRSVAIQKNPCEEGGRQPAPDTTSFSTPWRKKRLWGGRWGPVSLAGRLQRIPFENKKIVCARGEGKEIGSLQKLEARLLAGYRFTRTAKAQPCLS